MRRTARTSYRRTLTYESQPRIRLERGDKLAWVITSRSKEERGKRKRRRGGEKEARYIVEDVLHPCILNALVCSQVVLINSLQPCCRLSETTCIR